MKIMVISPIASHQPTGGAKRRIYNLLKYLQKQGHSVDYVYTCHETTDLEHAVTLMQGDWDSVTVIPSDIDYTQKSLSADYGVDDWIEPGSGERVTELCERLKPDLVLIQYVFQSYYADFVPDGVPVVLDAHDKLSRRHLFEEEGMEPGFFYTTEEDELRGLARADVVLSIQDNEANYFRRSGSDVVVIGHIEKARFAERRFDGLSKIGIIAAHNKFNIHGVERVVPAVLERLDALNADVRVYVCGNVTEGLKISHPKLVKQGFVEDLDEFYNEMDLILNPTLKGTGLKIKTIEAMSRGLPLVSTKTGFDGLTAQVPFHSGQDAAAIADLIEGVYKSQFSSLTKLANVSRAIFTEYQYNLDRNLKAVFSDELVVRKRDGGDLGEFLTKHTSLIGSPDAENYIRAKDITHERADFSLAHVINPVDLPPTSDLYLAQPLTFESMRRAKLAASADVEVDLLAVSYPEDQSALPAGDFKPIMDLHRSVLDVGQFRVPRKLPLVHDLIATGFKHTDAEYVVFTNADIGLTPQFYTRVAELIQAGHDAIVINRRTISKAHASVDVIGAALADYGKDHPGYDCFVIRRDHFEKFNLGHICVGVHLIGRVLLWNLLAFSRSFHLEISEHLTFHVGDDVPSKDDRLLDYVEHNASEALNILDDLETRSGLLTRLTLAEDRKLLTMNFGPSLFRKFEAGRNKPALEKTVMIHSLFRAGSTYIWRKIRALHNVKAYYEPLHEDLHMLRKDGLEQMKDRHRLSRYHAQDEDDWAFREFETLLDKDESGELSHYDARFAYDEFAPPFDQSALKNYIDELIADADENAAVLQFNRSSLRQAWFAESYPDACHIYLHRSAREQWASYAGFRVNGRMGFLRNTLMIAGKNAEKPLFAPLAKLIPLIGTPNTKNMHQLYDGLYDYYALEDIYTAFYYVWLVSLFQAVCNADLIVDMERLRDDRLYQLETEFRLMKANIELDLSDADVPRYDPETLGLTSSEFAEIENTVFRAIVASDLEIPFEALKDAGFDELAARLERSAGEGMPRIPDDLPERVSRLQTKLSETLAEIDADRWTPSVFEDERVFAPRSYLSFTPRDQLPFNRMIGASGPWIRGILGDGWSSARKDYLTADAKTASFSLSLPLAPDLALRLWARSNEQATSRKTTIRFDGHNVFEGQLADDWRVVEMPLPEEATILRSLHTLEIESQDKGNIELKAFEVLAPDKVLERKIGVDARDSEWVERHQLKEPEEGFLYLEDIFPLNQASRSSFVFGWSGPETSDVIWTDSAIADVKFRLKSSHDSFVLKLATISALAANEDMFEISLNGTVIYAGPLIETPVDVVVRGVSALLKTTAYNHLRIRTRRTYRPVDDPRDIAVMLKSVQVTDMPDVSGEVVLEMKSDSADLISQVYDTSGTFLRSTGDLAKEKDHSRSSTEKTSQYPGINTLFPIKTGALTAFKLGWAGPEDPGVIWSVKELAEIRFQTENVAESLKLTLSTVPQLSGDEGMFVIRLNGMEVYAGPLWADARDIVITDCAKLIRAGGVNSLSFESRQTFQPEGDPRQLGILVRDVKLSDQLEEPAGVVIWQSDTQYVRARVYGPQNPSRSSDQVHRVSNRTHLPLDQDLIPSQPSYDLVEGWSYPEGEVIWAVQRSASLSFQLKNRSNLPKSIKLNLSCVAGETRSIKILINGFMLGTCEIDGDQAEFDISIDNPGIFEDETTHVLTFEDMSNLPGHQESGGRSLYFLLGKLRFVST